MSIEHQWWCGGRAPCACTTGWKEEQKEKEACAEIRQRVMVGVEELMADFYIDGSGVLYERVGGGLLSPHWGDFAEDEALALGGRDFRVDHKAPYRCSGCGTDRLQVYESDQWETSAMCPDCGITQVVHDG